MFTTDIEASLKLLSRLHKNEPHLRIRFGDWELIGIGDILLVGGTEESLAPIRNSLGPFVVDDLELTQRELEACGAEITLPIAPAPTGRFLYAKHPDGNVVEYVEWTPELVEKWIAAPQREGKLASQL